MKVRMFMPFLLGVVLLVSCSSGGGLIGKEKKAKVSARLQERPWIPAREAEQGAELQDAMDFLYAYMPYGDVADYSAELFRSNAEASLAAREQMSWGATVPEELFLHFVLPVRVNNENLDTSRVDFYAELKDRVAGKSMLDAILEVNHWCHEKVVYTPTDGRTSSPSALVRNAAGRCGEESTFTVAALRAVGIPARQIYVPRWAHTDDNHAWVEAWADGTWYYIGACEPEPVTNKGWFDSPAKRSLLMFTKVFGDYSGAEEVIGTADSYTEINVTENYAPVKSFTVLVVDQNDKPVSDAQVMFNIYNYAEQYTAIRTQTNDKGEVSFTAGLGDVMVWAKKDGQYGRGEIDLRKSDLLKVVLSKKDGDVYAYQEDIVPPVELPVTNTVTPEQRAENDRRWAQEDSIRGAYVATFLKKSDAEALASKLGVDAKRIEPLIVGARGNSQEVYDFLSETPASQMEVALQLLEVISPKDLRDTPKSVLRNHLDGAVAYKDKEYFVEYILNPRVDTELLTPYRAELSAVALDAPLPTADADVLNAAGIPVSPLGVLRLGMADKAAYERYLITLYRSHGIAARKEPLTERPQYFEGGSWKYFELPWASTEATKVADKGNLVVALDGGKNYTDDPKYYSHFSLARLVDGEFVTLDMSHSVAADMGEGVSYKTLFAKPLELEVGTYQLTTGTRMADGTILMQGEIFNVEAGKTVNVPMVLRQNSQELQVIGNINPEVLYIPMGATSESSLLSTTGRGYFIFALVDAKKEPTTHLLRGMEAIKADLEAWGRPIVLVFRDKGQESTYNGADFPALPSTISYGSDSDGKMLEMATSMLKLDAGTDLPIVVVGDSFGRVVYVSTGYNTSVRNQLKETIGKL